MVNIFSNSEDSTTDDVIEYLRYFSSIEIQRVHDYSEYSGLTISINNEGDSVELNDTQNKEYNVKQNAGWLRRGVLSFNIPINLESFNTRIKTHITQELSYLREFIYSYSLKIGNFQKEINNNRLTNILVAKECGLKIPDTIVTSSRVDLLSFVKKHTLIITKPIHNGHLSFEHDNIKYHCKGITLLDYKFVSNLETRFCPSLFQEYIEKDMELRIFYLNGKFFPMAIFSQLDEMTRYDYRNYNKVKPNRDVPFKLNLEIENKLSEFMKRVGLETGSIDIILTPQGEYYFLEVNPTGQFGWVSVDCNYYIEREIALNLINNGTR
jgi:ATP-GRASP peptide maturase of grasp-with-spasm system